MVNTSGLPAGTVTLVSDQALADEVQDKAISAHIAQLIKIPRAYGKNEPADRSPWGSKDLDAPMSDVVRPKDVQAVPVIDSTAVAWQVSAGDLLLRLGLALAPGAGGQSPHLSSVHWPLVKYVDFFQEVNGQLCAGPQADRYVQHGRTAISDELGVAFSLLAAERWLREEYSLDVIDIVDVEQVLGGVLGSRKVSSVPGASRRPDWLILGGRTGASGALKAFALESKGASRGGASSNAHHVKSLASAVEQLSSMEVDGKVPVGLASLAITGAGPVVVKAVDPGDDSADVHITPSMIQEMSEGGLSGNASALPNEQTGMSLAEVATAISLQSLRNIARISHDARAQEFLGVQEPTSGEPERIDTSFGEALGTSARSRDRQGRNFRAFIGVPASIITPLAEGELESAIKARDNVVRSIRRPSSEAGDDPELQGAQKVMEQEFHAPNGALMIFEREG